MNLVASVTERFTRFSNLGAITTHANGRLSGDAVYPQQIKPRDCARSECDVRMLFDSTLPQSKDCKYSKNKCRRTTYFQMKARLAAKS
jgi:hypothetical protein